MEEKKILVMGDLMLDHYTVGDVSRISPEAPVPILHVRREERKAGGAGNAILNLISLGMEVVACGRVGEDLAGRDLVATLESHGVDTSGIFVQKGYQTPVKNRVMSAGQQLVRIDHECHTPLTAQLHETLLAFLQDCVQRVDLVAISDYGKGLCQESLLKKVMGSVPVVIDPKARDFSRYRGATLIKPNLLEAKVASGLEMNATLDEVAEAILQAYAIEQLMITRSKDGISLFSAGGNRQDFAAQVHEVRDVTGAGDTVLAVIAACMANSWDLSDAIELANRAAGLAIEKVGCACISREELCLR